MLDKVGVMKKSDDVTKLAEINKDLSTFEKHFLRAQPVLHAQVILVCCYVDITHRISRWNY
jgi:hypothetical protein